MSASEPVAVRVAFKGPLFRVEVQTWGDRRRDVVRHPGACGAVVLIEGDRVLLVRQLREAVGRALLEIPAGVRDVPGESAEQTVRREILEETGHLVARIKPLGGILTTPGFSDERIELFLAWAGPGAPAPVAEAGVETVTVRFDEAVRMVSAGEIEDAKTCVGLLLARDARRGQER